LQDTIRSYEGTGSLHYPGAEIPCEFAAVQEHDGGVHLTCTTTPGYVPQEWAVQLFGGVYQKASHFEGQTAAGRPVRVSGPMIGRPTKLGLGGGSSVARFILSGPGGHLTVGERSPSDRWRVGIACLRFESHQRQWRGENGWYAGEMALRVDDCIVTFRKLDDYDASVAEMSARESVRVTSEVELPAGLTFDRARQLVGDLCALLSIAHGTLVTPSYCEQVSDAGQVTYAYHYPAVTRPYNGNLPLIDPDEPAELATFLETAFPSFRQKSVAMQLHKLVRAVTDSRTLGFLLSFRLESYLPRQEVEIHDFATGVQIRQHRTRAF
jgi:hypothetical protein